MLARGVDREEAQPAEVGVHRNDGGVLRDTPGQPEPAAAEHQHEDGLLAALPGSDPDHQRQIVAPGDHLPVGRVQVERQPTPGDNLHCNGRHDVRRTGVRRHLSEGGDGGEPPVPRDPPGEPRQPVVGLDGHPVGRGPVAEVLQHRSLERGAVGEGSGEPVRGVERGRLRWERVGGEPARTGRREEQGEPHQNRELVDLADLGEALLERHLEVAQEPVVQIVDPAVDDRVAVLEPVLLDRGGLDHVVALLVDVELHQPAVPLRWIGDRVELGPVEAVDVADLPQPAVEQPEVLRGHRRRDPAAAVVTADDDVFDVEDSTA